MNKKLIYLITIIVLITSLSLFYLIALKPNGISNQDKLVEEVANEIYNTEDSKKFCETYFSDFTVNYCMNYVDDIKQYDSYSVVNITKNSNVYFVDVNIEDITVTFEYSIISYPLRGLEGVLYDNIYKIDLIVLS